MKQPASLRRQTGLGWFGVIIIVLMAGVLGLMALRLVPLYIDYFHVLDVARTLQREPGVAQKSKAELKTIVSGRFRQNNMYKMKPTVLKFSKNAAQQLVIKIDYEERVTLFFNIDLVARFNRTLFPS